MMEHDEFNSSNEPEQSANTNNMTGATDSIQEQVPDQSLKAAQNSDTAAETVHAEGTSTNTTQPGTCYSTANQQQPNVSNNVPPKKKKHHPWLIAIPATLIGLLLCGTLIVGAVTLSGGIIRNLTSLGNGIIDKEPNESNGTQSTLAFNEEAETDGQTNSGVQLSQTLTSSDTTSDSLSDMVEEVLPSVVCINITADMTYTQFGQSYSGKSSASGSGVIVSQDDDYVYIVTNNHVVSSDSSSSNDSFYFYSSSVSNTEISVVFSDESAVDAELRGCDEEKDLAVIAVPMSDISADTLKAIKIATIGNSDDIRLGSQAIAIGNALGYGQSVTSGIISALNREVSFSDGYTRTLLQTDAAINPGNSGGGLFDSEGNLIGINSAKLSSTDVEGVGYAIPISDVTDLIVDLINYVEPEPLAEDQQGFLGVSGQDITSELSSVYGMPVGVYVTLVVEDSPAATYGIRTKDIITAVEGTSITSRTQLTDVVKTYAVGDTVTVTISRLQNGSYKEQDIKVTLASRSEYQSSLEQSAEESAPNSDSNGFNR